MLSNPYHIPPPPPFPVGNPDVHVISIYIQLGCSMYYIIELAVCNSISVLLSLSSFLVSLSLTHTHKPFIGPVLYPAIIEGSS